MCIPAVSSPPPKARTCAASGRRPLGGHSASAVLSTRPGRQGMVGPASAYARKRWRRGVCRCVLVSADQRNVSEKGTCLTGSDVVSSVGWWGLRGHKRQHGVCVRCGECLLPPPHPPPTPPTPTPTRCRSPCVLTHPADSQAAALHLFPPPPHFGAARCVRASRHPTTSTELAQHSRHTGTPAMEKTCWSSVGRPKECHDHCQVIHVFDPRSQVNPCVVCVFDASTHGQAQYINALTKQVFPC
jgi:hypothetical protein